MTDISKILQRKLEKRKIDITKQTKKIITINEPIFGPWHTFTKDDLEDKGSYSLELDDGDYDSDNYSIFHKYKREETIEELGERLCKEYDAKVENKRTKEQIKERELKRLEELKKKYE